MTVAKGAAFCGEHGNGERMACPLDPKHSCFKATLKKHLNKCKARLVEQTDYLVPKINAATNSEEENLGPNLNDLSENELVELVEKIEKSFETIPSCDTSVLEHEALAPQLEAPDCGLKARKHLIQNASLLANIQLQDFLRDNTTIVEFGAGRGQLGYWLGHVLQDKKNCTIVLVDRASTRHKLDNKLKDGNVAVNRVRADIADLNLAKLIPEGSHLVGVCKHLCGEATDLSLQCLLRTIESGSKLAGLVMAPCCHHRCTWKNFIGREYFVELGFDKSSFRAICGISSWATCGSGRPRLAQTQNAIGEIHPLDRYTRLNYCQKTREIIGRKAKMVLNYARLKDVEKRGLKGRLFYYVPETLSPENVCFIAEPIVENL